MKTNGLRRLPQLRQSQPLLVLFVVTEPPQELADGLAPHIPYNTRLTVQWIEANSLSRVHTELHATDDLKVRLFVTKQWTHQNASAT